MGFVPSRDLFKLGFFGVPVRFRPTLDRISWRVNTKKHQPKPAFLGKTISRVVQCDTAESITDLKIFLVI